MEDDEHTGMPDLVTDDEEQESIDGMPNFVVQDDGIIDFMHNITIMTFPDEVIRVNKKSGQIVLLRNIVCGPIEPGTKPIFPPFPTFCFPTFFCLGFRV